MTFRYPFPGDPGAQRKVATVTMKVLLDDGSCVTYVGSATRADYETLPGGDVPALDPGSPSGVAQSHRSTIDWVAGTVFRLEPHDERQPELPPPAIQREIEPRARTRAGVEKQDAKRSDLRNGPDGDPHTPSGI